MACRMSNRVSGVEIMAEYRERAGLQVAPVLADFIEGQLLPGLPVTADAFWSGCAALLKDLVPDSRRLLDTRDQLQARIDDWLQARRGQDWDNAAWIGFLREIGYLQPEGPEF